METNTNERSFMSNEELESIEVIGNKTPTSPFQYKSTKNGGTNATIQTWGTSKNVMNGYQQVDVKSLVIIHSTTPISLNIFRIQ